MTQLSDSRSPRGIGILILQHADYHKKGFSIDLRGGLLAARVMDRDDEGDGLGSWYYDPDSVGDLNGGFLWPNVKGLSGSARPIPGWAFAWPARLRGGRSGVETPGNRTKTPTGSPFKDVETPSNQAIRTPMGSVPSSPPGGRNKACGLMESVNMIPVHNDDMTDDARYAELAPQFPTGKNGKRLWPKLPRGHFGIALTATNEERQIEYFHSTDPRLVAVNAGGDPACGSLICDLNEKHEYDEDRTARLQSMTWVVKKPDG